MLINVEQSPDSAESVTLTWVELAEVQDVDLIFMLFMGTQGF